VSIEQIILFVGEHPKAVVTTVGVLGEIIVIAVNTYRRIRHSKKQAPQSAMTEKFMDTVQEKPGFLKKVLWVANPINLRRSPSNLDGR